ncbi:hypothetical protein BK660_21690 [Pseudomonas brassicacearum]|uniref:Uncharacterized protein n=1 Tax=Pseudomonas brassicacearum TaxID=930166 RepID=A0A423HXN1_9PSED|nr:hypothetical protein [Pseudomonas brassicacearum]RON17906.1 hypothetical protein BK660_21690 [Pseudomonas brassicacearum]
MSEVKCSTCKGTKRIEFERGQRCVPCVTCSGSGVDWRKSCESGQSELAALREELALKLEAYQGAHMMVTDLKAELRAAEQLNAELVTLLNGYPRGVPGFAEWAGKVGATLKPTESGASDVHL